MSSFPPKIQELINQAHGTGKLIPFLSLLSRFGVGGTVISTVASEIADVREQVDALVQLTISFQGAFLELGWLFSESTNVETAKKALQAHQEGKSSEAETLLATDYEGERLDFVVMRLCNSGVFMERKEQLVEAADLTREGRYLASIPLLLIVADGVGSDEFGKSLFAKGVDLEELNSFAGQPDALPVLVRKMCDMRRKSSSEHLDFPYRNGIIHGRDLSYGNRLVNAKCWSLLGNLADVIRARNTAEELDSEREPTFRDTLASLVRSSELKHQINSWAKRPVIDSRIHVSEDAQSRMNKHEPEAALAVFLLAWNRSNYGYMVQMTMDRSRDSINSRAGELSRNLQHVILVDAFITRIEDMAPALAELTVELTFRSDCEAFVNEFVFRMICQDKAGGGAVRGYDGTHWLVRPEYKYQYWSELHSTSKK